MTRFSRAIVVATSALAVVACVALVRSRAVPLGVPGEWEWLRVRFSPWPSFVLLGCAAIAAYSLFAALGARALAGEPTRWTQRGWVAALFLAALGVQVAIQAAGPDGHGSSKVVTLALRGSSGYFDVAREQMADPWRFWADYPRWIRDQDALHVGTHPPGLFLASRALLGVMRAHPAFESLVASCVPRAASDAFTFYRPRDPMPRADRSAVALMALLTLFSCSGTVVPLYALARSSLSPQASWMAAILWPLAPAAILFQPAADTGFPFLATSALALAATGGGFRAVWAGVALGVGMQFSLAFLPIGLVVGLVQVSRPEVRKFDRARLVIGTGAGFLAVTMAVGMASAANPFAIWWWNQKNHARFYVENPRSYAAWVLVNPVELAVAVGLPTAIWAGAGLASGRAPRASVATLAVVLVLNLSGRNLSEVARLWLPLMPAFPLAAGAGMTRARAGSITLALTVALLGILTISLQGFIQVVHAIE